MFHVDTYVSCVWQTNKNVTIFIFISKAENHFQLYYLTSVMIDVVQYVKVITHEEK